MKALKCDICGEYFETIKTIRDMPENKKPNRLYMYYQANSGQTKDYVEADICPDCYDAIKKAMDDRKKIHISDPNDDDLK